MATRSFTYYMIKVARVTGWFLLPLMVLYVLTGFALCGKFGFERLMDIQLALEIHKLFDWPLVVVFLVHAGAAVYVAMRRWGWF